MMHSQVEEEIFYPAIRNLLFGEEVSKVNEAYHQHHILKDLLNQISTMDPISNEFDSKIAELKQKIDQHVAQEESEMLELITRRMPSEQLERIGQQMHDRKMNLKTQMAA